MQFDIHKSKSEKENNDMLDLIEGSIDNSWLTICFENIDMASISGCIIQKLQ